MNGFRMVPAALAMLLAAGTALADTYEGFNYPAGQLLNLQSGGTGFTNAWSASQPDYSIQNGSLSYGGLTATGNSASFSETGANGTTSWVSFLIRPDSDPTVGLMEFGIENMEIGKVFAGSPNFYAVGAGGDIEYSAVPIVQGQTAFVVIEMQFNADPAGQDTATVFFDPTPGLAAPNVAGLTWTENFSTSISDLAFDGGNGQAFSFDEIRIGSSFANVSPASIVATPEPSSIWLIATGIALPVGRRFLARRRKRGQAKRCKSSGSSDRTI